MTEPVSDLARELDDRARAASLNVRHSASGRGLVISFPSGRAKRDVYVGNRAWESFKAADFENWVFLDGYSAIANRANNSIEAIILGVSHSILTMLDRFNKPAPTDPASPEASVDSRSPVVTLPQSPDSPILVEISDATPALQFVSRHDPGNARIFSTNLLSLKISGLSDVSHDAALTFLERFASSLSFDFDLRYGVNLRLAPNLGYGRSGKIGRYGIRETQPPPLRMPTVTYSRQAMALYQYGLSIQAMPLMQFLAYYQVLEYYFPTYAQAETVRRLRQQIIDPRFDPHSDADLGRLANLIRGQGRSFMTERDQLRATVKYCTTDVDLASVVTDDPTRQEFLTGKQKLKGVNSINLKDGQYRLGDQVADRLYAIRCRIVHSKEDSGAQGTEILLPLSAEAKQLDSDIEIARYLAQRVLIAGARPARW